MGELIHGERLYGQVELVPGDRYVSTLFRHLNFLPIIPRGSYSIVDGSEQGEEFQGDPIPLNWKSVVVGYLRGWCGTIALVVAMLSGFSAVAHLWGHDLVLLGFIPSAAATGAVYFVLRTERKWYLPVQATLHLVTLAWWLLVVSQSDGRPLKTQQSLERYWIVLVVANSALFGYSLTRLFTYKRLPQPDRLTFDDIHESLPNIRR